MLLTGLRVYTELNEKDLEKKNYLKDKSVWFLLIFVFILIVWIFVFILYFKLSAVIGLLFLVFVNQVFLKFIKNKNSNEIFKYFKKMSLKRPYLYYCLVCLLFALFMLF